jgi:hypothetical protein
MINLPVETVQEIVDTLNLGLNAEGDAFGIWHNNVTDLVGTLEVLIERSNEE